MIILGLLVCQYLNGELRVKSGLKVGYITKDSLVCDTELRNIYII